MRLKSLMLIGLVLLITGCAPVSTPDVVTDDGELQYGETADVESVTVLLMESFPVQARAVIKGQLPDGCTGISEVSVSRANETFTVKIITARPSAVLCTMGQMPFEETVSLDVLDLPAGTYTVNAYGTTAEFTFDVQNSIQENPTDIPASLEQTPEKVEDSSATPVTPTATPEPSPTPAAEAQYLLTFRATWSADTHPEDFPSNPHFSDLAGAVHKPRVVIWEKGALASPGIKSMAELGAVRPLNTEVNALIAAGDACELISGGGIRVSPGAVEVTFTASQLCPVVSVVTMIAPSPDWFVGVSALILLQNGAWVDEVVVDLLPYDAGTDSGESYTSSNATTNPPVEIDRIETAPLRVADSVPPLGTFTFTRINP